eukprot:gene4548-14904_t
MRGKGRRHQAGTTERRNSAGKKEMKRSAFTRTNTQGQQKEQLKEKERERKGPNREYNRLENIINLRQEASARREERYQVQIKALKERLDALCVHVQDDDSMMAQLRETNRQIQEKVSQ